MSRVVHSAQALVDIVAEIPHLPERGDNVNAASVSRWAGGAVTILVAAARLGARAAHAGAIGRGPNGDLIRSVFTSEGIDYDAQAIDARDTGECFVMVEPNAQRTFVTSYGAERDISAESLARTPVAAGDFLCVSGYSLYPPTREPLMDYLARIPAGVRVVLDPGEPFASFRSALKSEVLGRTHVWTSNADEARAFTGVRDIDQVMASVAASLPSGSVVIVRDGAHGCWVGEDERVIHCPGYPRRAVDTNGAGDTHTGAMLALVGQGLTWPDAAQIANAAGAIAVTRRGPASAPRREEVVEFLRAEGAVELAERL